jgi:transposase-like protein
MARRGYLPGFRRRVVDPVEGGRKISKVAAELEMSEQAIYTWRRQAGSGLHSLARYLRPGLELAHQVHP